MVSTSYTYTKATVDIQALKQEILDDATITTAVDYITHTDDPPTNNLVIWFVDALTGGEVSALDTIVANHDGQALTSEFYSTSLLIEAVKLKVLIQSYLSIANVSGFMDDFSDTQDDGIDTSMSSGYAISDNEFAYVAKGQTSATIVTPTITIYGSPRSKVKVFRYMYEGADDFYISSDNGNTWQQVLVFGEEISTTAGTKFRLKVNLTGTDKLAVWGVIIY